MIESLVASPEIKWNVLKPQRNLEACPLRGNLFAGIMRGTFKPNPTEL
jgi:hypothetical protein